MNRRKFLTLAGAAAALAASPVKTFESMTMSANAASKAKKGAKRWAMAIYTKEFKRNPQLLDACIKACNVVHNIPHIDSPKSEVKWIWKEKFKHAFIEQENERLPEKINEMTVLLLCNHCDEPPCVNVCPTQATWRREEDGIVMMDWHRCIGCRYCMAACPYGSRSFNYQDPRPNIPTQHDKFPTRSKGVVEKCTFCAERIVNGKYIQAPACVEACQALGSNAIVFGDLYDPNSEISQTLKKHYTIRRKPELGTHPEVYYII